jgi:hypothetical protein
MASSISPVRGDAVVHEMQDLAPQRLLQAVGDVAVDLLRTFSDFMPIDV